MNRAGRGVLGGGSRPFAPGCRPQDDELQHSLDGAQYNPGLESAVLSRIAAILTVLVCTALAIWLYPIDCDAAFAVHDAIWYAIGAEQFPAGSLNPHHPLFHGIVLGLVPPLRALGVEGPGHVAVRIVAGLGGAWLLIQIAALAGRRRLLVGAAFAFTLFCTRGFLIEMAGGENVLPAAAASLWALRLASRPNPNLFATGAALAFALLMRQDDIFSVPAVAVALAMGLPAGKRLSGVAWLLIGAGLVTIAGYGIAWWINTSGGLEAPIPWLLRFGREGSWTGPKHFDWSRLPVYSNSLALAATGRVWPRMDDNAWRGVAYLFAILAPGIALRGTSPKLRLGVAILITLVGRAFFHSWFEADNYEWLVLPFAFVIAFASGLAHGDAATPRGARIAGLVFLGGLSLWILTAHAWDSWKLRERNLMAAIEEATNVDHGKWRFLALGARVGTGFRLLGIPYVEISTKGSGEGEYLPRVGEEILRNPVPTIVIHDRFVMDGMPYTLRHEGPIALDTGDLPNWELVRRSGRAYAGRWRPPVPETQSETRKSR
jgi:hypothetical protein